MEAGVRVANKIIFVADRDTDLLSTQTESHPVHSTSHVILCWCQQNVCKVLQDFARF